MTPAPEKAAPIPADVLEAAQSATFDIFGGHFSTYRRAAEVAIARAIMQDRADRASQKERVQEDEPLSERLRKSYEKGAEDKLNTLLQSANENSRAPGDEFWGRVAYWLLQLKIDRARLRGDAS